MTRRAVVTGAGLFAGCARRPISRSITSVAAAPDGSVVFGLASGAVVWEKGQELLVEGRVNDLCFSLDGSTLAVASRNLSLIDGTGRGAPRIIRDDGRNYGCVRFFSHGRRLLASTGRGTMEVIDAVTGKELSRACCSTIYGDVAILPGEREFVSAGHWPCIWSLGSSALIARLTRERQFMTYGPAVVDSTRKRVVLGSQDGSAQVWSLDTRERTMETPLVRGGYVDILAVHARTGTIFGGSHGRELVFWNPDTGARGAVSSVKPTGRIDFAPDGNTLVYGDDHGAIRRTNVLGFL